MYALLATRVSEDGPQEDGVGEEKGMDGCQGSCQALGHGVEAVLCPLRLASPARSPRAAPPPLLKTQTATQLPIKTRPRTAHPHHVHPHRLQSMKMKSLPVIVSKIRR